MRHVIIRLLIGIVWLIAAVFCGVQENFMFAAIYAILGVVFLFSAYSIWKKEKEKGNR